MSAFDRVLVDKSVELVCSHRRQQFPVFALPIALLAEERMSRSIVNIEPDLELFFSRFVMERYMSISKISSFCSKAVARTAASAKFCSAESKSPILR